MGSLKSAISESSKIDEEKKKQLEEITNQIDNQNQELFDLNSEKNSLTEKINRGKGLVEIELRAQHAGLTKKCEELASATQDSRYSDLESQENHFQRKLNL